MAGKSRVGSLYYEIVLDPAKFVRGASKVKGEQKELAGIIAKENKRIADNKDYKQRFQDEKDLIRKQVMARKLSVKEGIELTRMANRTYKQEQRAHTAMLRNEEKERKAIKAAALRKEVDLAHDQANKMVAEEEKEHQRLDRKYKAYLKNRHVVQRKWNKRRRKNQEETTKRMTAQEKELQAVQARNSMFGSGGKLSRGWGIFSAITIGALKAGIAIAAVVRGIKLVSGAVIGFVKEADKKKKSLITLTALYGGNKEVARELREEMVEYAKKTAFSVDQTMELAIQMRALGFNAKETVSAIKQFGRLAFGDPAKLKLIAKAYSDVKAQGKLMAVEVRQFANQGVPILAQLSRDLDVNQQKLRDMIKRGEVGFDDVAKAVQNIANAFGNVDEAGLETFTGQMEAATEAWTQLQAKIAENTGMDVSLKGMAEFLNLLIAVGDKQMDLFAGKQGLIYHFNELRKIFNELGLIMTGMRPMIMAMESLGLLDAEVDMTEIDKWLARLKAQDAVSKASLEHENKMANAAFEREQKRLKLVEHRASIEAQILKLGGDSSMLDRIEATARLAKAEADGVKVGGSNAGHQFRTDEKRLMLAEQQASYVDKFNSLQEQMVALNETRNERLNKLVEASLPGAMRQNSVEEWVYLKSLRDNRDREQREEAAADKRHAEGMQNLIDQTAALNDMNENITGIVTGL
jgi:tape measure domain-containing protein